MEDRAFFKNNNYVLFTVKMQMFILVQTSSPGSGFVGRVEQSPWLAGQQLLAWLHSCCWSASRQKIFLFSLVIAFPTWKMKSQSFSLLESYSLSHGQKSPAQTKLSRPPGGWQGEAAYYLLIGGAFKIWALIFFRLFPLGGGPEEISLRHIAKTLLELSESLKKQIINFTNSMLVVLVVEKGSCLECCVYRLFSPCRWSRKTSLRKSHITFDWVYIFCLYVICYFLQNFKKGLIKDKKKVHILNKISLLWYFWVNKI